MVTIADVAAYAGVGAGTVSRVLNNSPRVSAETRARVLAAIEVLDYRPNPMARGLSRGRCQTLGAVVPFFTHASAVERLRGVMAGLDGSRYDLVLFNVESPVHRDEHLASLTRRDRADGLLIVSLPPPAADLDRLAAAGVPVVLLDARGHGVPAVVTDDVEGGRIATRHLLELGHERIAFIGDDPANPFGFTSSAERERGYRESLAEAGLAERPGDVAHGPHVREVARELAGQLLDRGGEDGRPTAVFAASDTQALGVLEAARARGIRVPEDLSVVGFDDIEVSSYAGLTTVRQPLRESGRKAIGLLLEALTSEEPPPPEVHQLGLELVVRSTTAPPKGRRGRRRAGRSAAAARADRRAVKRRAAGAEGRANAEVASGGPGSPGPGAEGSASPAGQGGSSSGGRSGPGRGGGRRAGGRRSRAEGGPGAGRETAPPREGDSDE
ncbi:MAG TPA: LacI family DNA-binding transcriptional regulator [Acidimicrobiales bacterium]